MSQEQLNERTGKKLIDVNVAGYEQLPAPKELMDVVPLSKDNLEFILSSRKEDKKILDKKNKKKLIYVGPCSIHDPNQGIEFAKRLFSLQRMVSEQTIIRMRNYFEKPRTCIGWPGLIQDPYLNDSCKLAEGYKIAREYLIEVTNLGVASLTEFMSTLTPQFIGDLIVEAAIGARTTESPDHRKMASGLSMPVGFKNNTSGDISVAVDAAKAARYPHSFPGLDLYGRPASVRTFGNPYTYVILRGGNGIPNCKPEQVKSTVELMKKAELLPNVVIDCSHGNSEKKYEFQEKVAYGVLNQIINGNEDIIGIMLESNIYEGKQSFPKSPQEIANLKYGISITDGCTSWETAERIILKFYEELKKR